MSTLRQPTNDEITAGAPSSSAVPPSVAVPSSKEEATEQDAIPRDGSTLRPELRKVFEEGWKQNEAGYRHLAGR
jgi:hypothetical protein